MNVSYPHTREMIHSQKVSEMVRNLGLPVRIFLVNNQEDDVTLCKLDLFQMDSNGFLSYETKVTRNEPGLEEKYGFCGNSSAYATTSLYPTTTRKPPRPKKNILYWVLGAVAIAIVLAFLICLAGMMRRIFFPQFSRWDTSFAPNTGLKNKDGQSHISGRKHNSYAEAPKNAVYREKEPDDDIWEVVPSQLLITEQRLGSGAYAVVHKAVLSGVPPVFKKFPALQLANILSETENVVAAKTPKKNASLEEKLEFTQEIEFMKRLDYYPHLLSMIGCSSSVQYPVLLTEYCALGDLLHLVRALDGSSEAPQICFGDLVPLCWQMSDALAYLCARKIIHRDVAARNVLVTTDKMAKLSDFGLCRTDEQMMYTTRGGKLPIKWMAPESLDYAVFSAKTDVWSYGILLYEVFSFGKTPFITVDADILSEHLKEGNRMSIPERTPSRVSDLMRECWMERPEDRPDITVIRENLYSMMEAESDGYGYLTFSKNYYDVFKKKLHNYDEGYGV